MLALILALGVVGCSIPSDGQPAEKAAASAVNMVTTARSPTSMPTLEPTPEPAVQCDRLGDASTLSTKSAADWAVEYMGVCADFDGRLVASETDLHIIGSWDAPYSLDIAVAGSEVCLNAEEYVAGLGTPVSFVGRVVGTLDVDDRQTGGKLSLPLVQCWDGNRLDIVELCSSWIAMYQLDSDGTETFIPHEMRHECMGVTWEVPAPPFGTPLPPTITPIPPPR